MKSVISAVVLGLTAFTVHAERIIELPISTQGYLECKEIQNEMEKSHGPTVVIDKDNDYRIYRVYKDLYVSTTHCHDERSARAWTVTPKNNNIYVLTKKEGDSFIEKARIEEQQRELQRKQRVQDIMTRNGL